VTSSSLPNSPSPFIDPCFSVQFYAELWGLSVTTLYRWFREEPDVLKVAEAKRGKREYISLRIPWSVGQRVYKRHSR
jgi:hypothetical protein